MLGDIMFELFERIDLKIANRYKTIETNIKAKSNSFYESLLALLEGLARHIVVSQKIVIDSEFDTLIGILKVNSFKKYCLSINYSKSDYEELFKIAKLVNGHKHDEEALIELDIVIYYLEITFRFANAFYSSIYGKSNFTFDNKGIIEMYGQTEKEVDLLNKEKKRLEESLLSESTKAGLLESDLKKVLDIKKLKEKELTNIEKQKDNLIKQINELKDIKLSSMEEKVSEILNALRKQTDALNEMTSRLSFAAQLQIETIQATRASGKPIIRAWSDTVPYKANFDEYERFLLKSKYLEQAAHFAWKVIKDSRRVSENMDTLDNNNPRLNIEFIDGILSIKGKNSSDGKEVEKSMNEKEFLFWFREFTHRGYTLNNINSKDLFAIALTYLTPKFCIAKPDDELLEKFYFSGENFDLLIKSK